MFNDTTDDYRYRYEKIVKDTLLADGYVYFIKEIWYTTQVIHRTYYRIDSTSKIVMNSDGYEEFNLGANPDSIWVDNWGMENILHYDTSLIVGLNIIKPKMVFQQGYFFLNRTLGKGIGYCFAEYGDLGGNTLDFLVYAKIDGVEYGSIVNVEENDQKTSEKIFLSQNFPNPFNPTTKILYSIKEEVLVTLKVYDVLGKEVATLVNEAKPEGFYEVQFNATDIQSGVYFYKMQAGKFIFVNKMILMR
jgi:hypothetical protein